MYLVLVASHSRAVLGITRYSNILDLASNKERKGVTPQIFGIILQLLSPVMHNADSTTGKQSVVRSITGSTHSLRVDSTSV